MKDKNYLYRIKWNKNCIKYHNLIWNKYKLPRKLKKKIPKEKRLEYYTNWVNNKIKSVKL